MTGHANSTSHAGLTHTYTRHLSETGFGRRCSRSSTRSYHNTARGHESTVMSLLRRRSREQAAHDARRAADRRHVSTDIVVRGSLSCTARALVLREYTGIGGYVQACGARTRVWFGDCVHDARRTPDRKRHLHRHQFSLLESSWSTRERAVLDQGVERRRLRFTPALSS